MELRPEHISSEDNIMVEVFGDKLCFSLRGQDDVQIIQARDGHTEFIFTTNYREMLKVALHILDRLEQIREHQARVEEYRRRSAREARGGRGYYN